MDGQRRRAPAPRILRLVEAFTRTELLARLGGRRAFESALADGGCTRVLRGAYVLGSPPLDLTVRAAAVRRVLPLVAQGWVVLRCTADDLALRPYVLVREVRAALLRAA